MLGLQGSESCLNLFISFLVTRCSIVAIGSKLIVDIANIGFYHIGCIRLICPVIIKFIIVGGRIVTLSIRIFVAKI
ncbi:hypothetical protein D3C73_677560 [compost metagenome]